VEKLLEKLRSVEKAVEKASGLLKKLMKTRWVTVEPALGPLKNG
jgi:hypothetical protein